MARLEKGAEKAAEELQKYDPNNDPKVSGDPYKTLFVARLVSVLLILCKFYCL